MTWCLLQSLSIFSSSAVEPRHSITHRSLPRLCVKYRRATRNRNGQLGYFRYNFLEEWITRSNLLGNKGGTTCTSYIQAGSTYLQLVRNSGHLPTLFLNTSPHLFALSQIVLRRNLGQGQVKSQEKRVSESWTVRSIRALGKWCVEITWQSNPTSALTIHPGGTTGKRRLLQNEQRSSSKRIAIVLQN